LSSALRNVSNSAIVLSSTDPGLIMVLICCAIPSATHYNDSPNAKQSLEFTVTHSILSSWLNWLLVMGVMEQYFLF